MIRHLTLEFTTESAARAARAAIENHSNGSGEVRPSTKNFGGYSLTIAVGADKGQEQAIVEASMN